MRRDVFQAIADPTRREIINLIAHETLTPNGVANKFDLSRQAVSKHLKILFECGLISINKQGRERFCTIEAAKLDEVTEWIAGFRKIWNNRFDKLDDLLIRMQTTKQNEYEK